MSAGPHTVLVRNSMTGHQRYCGTFSCKEFADAYVEVESKRSRTFVSFEVWTGYPRNPGKPAGQIVKGTK